MTNTKNSACTDSAVVGKLIEMGDLKSADLDGTLHNQPMSILVRFDSVEDIRRAINEGVCRFVWP